jgi:hypothetical protein
VKVSYIQPLSLFYEMGVSVFEGYLVVYVVLEDDLNLRDRCLCASACDRNSRVLIVGVYIYIYTYKTSADRIQHELEWQNIL